MYGNCGQIHLARAAFENIHSTNRDIIAFNQMLSAYVKNSLIKQALDLYRKLCSQGHPEPDRITYFIVLGGCSAVKDLLQGREIHSRITASPEMSVETNVPLQNALINMYGKCGSPGEAREIFDGIGEKDRVSWTSMISSYANNGHCREALDLYQEMESAGVEPDRVTYTSVLLACDDLTAGKAIHDLIIRREMESDFVGSSLINMYSRCGDLSSAKLAFERIELKHVVCWTALMTAYLHSGLFREALGLYGRMELEGVHPDGVTLITALGACGSLGELERGEAIHSRVNESGFGSSIVIQTALLTMYAKCGRVERAREVFEGIRQRKNVHCWTAMISAHAQIGESREALGLYDRMIAEGIRANEYTFSNLLAGCCLSGDLQQGKRIHEDLRRSGLEHNIVVQNALVSMYSKCGSLELARASFESSRSRDLVTWNAMIGAYAHHGCGREALELLGCMEEQGMKPDEVTIASGLSACSMTGSLRQGMQIHSRMIISSPEKLQLESSVTVQAALVSLYGRCGRLDTAKTIFESGCLMKKPGEVFLWTAMAEAYAHQGHASEALELYHAMVLDGLRPNEITATSVLIGCSHAGLLASGVECFQDLQSEHGVAPIREHFLCMVDLLGRAGRVSDAESLVESMPFEPDSVAWLTVLGCCKTQVDAECARRVAGRIQELDPGNTSLYSLLSSVFTEVGLKQEAAEVLVDMRVKRGLKKPPGSSSLDLLERDESSRETMHWNQEVVLH